MRYCLVLAGELDVSLLHDEQEEVRWVGVDRGAFSIVKEGLPLIAAIGDFDSGDSPAKLAHLETLQQLEIAHREKDETDLELAVRWLTSREDVTEIVLYGATGGRYDHQYATLFYLARQKQQGLLSAPTIIKDVNNKQSIYTKGTYNVERDEEKPYVSFLPLNGDVSGLTLHGMKYELNDCHISFGSTLCISNELIKQHGSFSFKEGVLLLVQSRDGSAPK
ncbi:thiamine diphosphokinase [Bacillus fonticola]|uniref:thiamine diphosphokinase n=1 Tax=Bacillus fonticola TaxID=2728853 RepID=UPI001475CDD7|nr:thiamine diphosphokinase [Bacillus fonticola]